MTEVSSSQTFDELFTRAEREPPTLCQLLVTGPQNSYSGPVSRLASQNNSRGSPSRKPTANQGLCPANPAMLEMRKHSAASRSHSMRDQTAHMREKYQGDYKNQRRQSTKGPSGTKHITQQANQSVNQSPARNSRTNSITGDVEVTRQFLATNKRVINRGDSFKRKEKNLTKKQEQKERADAVAAAAREEEEEERTGLPHKIYRVAFLGGSQVGKTSIIDQFMSSEHADVYERGGLDSEQGDSDVDIRTVSVDVNGEESRLDLIEPAVSDLTAKEIAEEQNPDCFIIVYAVDDKDSFKYAGNCLQWLARNSCLSVKPCILVGNKSDLARTRTVESGEGCDLAVQYSVKFTEASPGCGHHIDELLVGIVLQLRLYESGHPKHHSHKSIKETMKGIISLVTGKEDEKRRNCRNLNI